MEDVDYPSLGKSFVSVRTSCVLSDCMYWVTICVCVCVSVCTCMCANFQLVRGEGGDSILSEDKGERLRHKASKNFSDGNGSQTTPLFLAC